VAAVQHRSAARALSFRVTAMQRAGFYAPPGGMMWPPPPPPPRAVPSVSTTELSTQNLDVFVGTMFMVMGAIFSVLLIGIPFFFIGRSIRKKGLAERGRKQEVLTQGAHTAGQVTRVVHLDSPRDPTTHVSTGYSMSWRVDYTFALGAQSFVGSDFLTGMNADPFAPGLPVWVVFLPADPSRNALWPPLR
jgi:hypothetical protein